MANASTLSFRLKGQWARAMIKLFAAMALASWVVALALFAARVQTASAALWLAGSMLALCAAGALSFWWQFRGRVELTSEGIAVIGGWGTWNFYRWPDIASIRLARLSERGRADRFTSRLFGLDLDRPFVEVALRRSVEMLPMSGHHGTGIGGVPTGLKRTMVEVEDPERFVTEAQTFLTSFGAEQEEAARGKIAAAVRFLGELLAGVASGVAVAATGMILTAAFTAATLLTYVSSKPLGFTVLSLFTLSAFGAMLLNRRGRIGSPPGMGERVRMFYWVSSAVALIALWGAIAGPG